MNTNTNINDYSIEDLLNLLEIELENLSKEEIIEKIEFLNNNYFNENNNMQSFFYSVQNKLLNFLDNTINNNNNYNLKDILPNNNLIETMANIEDSQLDLQIQDEDNSEQENTEEQNTEQQNALQEKNIQTSYNSFELVNLDKSIIENYEIYNYLHFNTLFRAKNNPLAETLIPSTNSNFILSEPINNISELKLASLTIKKPFLISELKSNNKFAIKKYNRSLICDFSALIILDDGYYQDKEDLVNLINDKLTSFTSSNLSGKDFINALTFSIDDNNNKIKFDLCYNEISLNNIDFHHYTLDFKSYYTPYYSLATILGFDYNKTDIYINSINASNEPSNNTIITSNYCFSNIGNKELFFCFDEYQQNIIETHKLFLNNNMSTFKILGKINATLGNKSNNFYINEVFTKTSRYDIIRKYDGVINLLNFNIKIIDYYGNIVNTINNEDFTFTLEAKLKLTRITQ
jgi:hypothetical protein